MVEAAKERGAEMKFGIITDIHNNAVALEKCWTI